MSLIVCGIGYAAVLGIGIAAGGMQALYGVGLGTAVSVFSIWSLAVLTKSFLGTQPQPKEGVQRTVLVSILKFPILLVFIFFGTRLSGAGIGCFLASIGLVYSSFIAFRSFADA